MRIPLHFIIPVLLMITACRCGYSLSGTSKDENIKTISIYQFENNARIVVPTLSQDFTNMLRDKFLTQGGGLKMVDDGGDVVLSGAITQYDIKPISIQGNETAAQSRLTISVNVEYENNVYPDQSWTSSFTNFSDFDSNLDLSSVEGQLIEEINDRITQDIFNKAFGNW